MLPAIIYLNPAERDLEFCCIPMREYVAIPVISIKTNRLKRSRVIISPVIPKTSIKNNDRAYALISLNLEYRNIPDINAARFTKKMKRASSKPSCKLMENGGLKPAVKICFAAASPVNLKSHKAEIAVTAASAR